jgi:hypothetical protein
VIVTSQVGQKHVDDIFVNRDMLHRTIAYHTIALLQAVSKR